MRSLADSRRPAPVGFALAVWILVFFPVWSGEAPAASDGQIVEQQPWPLGERFGGAVECYRVKYWSDGLKVVGYFLKPRGDSGRLPVLIYNRGGNREYGKISQPLLDYFLAYLAASGYLVVASQYRGNDGGEGREEFGGADVRDILNLLPLCRGLPFADAERVVMLGDSRGGMMTYLAIKSGAPLQAAAVIGAPANLEESYQARTAFGQVLEDLIGGTPEKQASAYRERSAYYWPEKLTVPLLILHGERDWRVPCEQSQKLAQRLQELSLPHELVVFPGGDHGLFRARQERNRLILEWFDKHLQRKRVTATSPAVLVRAALSH
jgi:dipeptidyl aminopeptidase/acylaminoacyl peptidase